MVIASVSCVNWVAKYIGAWEEKSPKIGETSSLADIDPVPRGLSNAQGSVSLVAYASQERQGKLERGS
jgi:hypothetical protein